MLFLSVLPFCPSSKPPSLLTQSFSQRNFLTLGHWLQRVHLTMLMLATRKCIYWEKKDLMKEPSIISAELIRDGRGEGADGPQEDFLAGGEGSAAINSFLLQGWRHIPRIILGKTQIIDVQKYSEEQSSRGTWELVSSFRWSHRLWLTWGTQSESWDVGRGTLTWDWPCPVLHSRTVQAGHLPADCKAPSKNAFKCISGCFNF